MIQEIKGNFIKHRITEDILKWKVENEMDSVVWYT